MLDKDNTASLIVLWKMHVTLFPWLCNCAVTECRQPIIYVTIMLPKLILKSVKYTYLDKMKSSIVPILKQQFPGGRGMHIETLLFAAFSKWTVDSYCYVYSTGLINNISACMQVAMILVMLSPQGQAERAEDHGRNGALQLFGKWYISLTLSIILWRKWPISQIEHTLYLGISL